MKSNQIHARLLERFGDGIVKFEGGAKDPYVVLEAEALFAVCKFLRDEPDLSFDFLTNETAFDDGKVITLVYHLYSYTHRHPFVVKLPVGRDNPEVDSVEPLWKVANWLEREIFDLFGVGFRNHPDLRRIMMPEDWVGYPLRKDYKEEPSYREIVTTRVRPMDQYKKLDKWKQQQRDKAAAGDTDAAPAAAPAAESEETAS